MKVCITSQGPDLESQVDPRFGRCAYFVFYDLDADNFEIIENPNISGVSGVGIQNAQLMAEKGVEVVITGNLGPNAASVLQQAGIRVITGVSGKVKDVIERIKREGISGMPPQSNVPPHFGMGFGPGMGRGMGMGRGRGMGMRRNMPFMPPPPPFSQQFPGVQPPQVSPMDKQQEIQFLKQQAEFLKRQIEEINKRIKKIERGESLIPQIDKTRCVGCGICVNVCPVNAIQLVSNKAEIDKSKCNGCGVCVFNCPQGAISL